MNLFLILHALVTSALLFGVPLLDRSRIPLVLVLILTVLGLASDRPRLHLVIAVTALLAQVLGFGALWLEPGAIRPS